jgi:tetratricopeptide (TPR) repeat protein
LKISVQLARTSDGTAIWSETYDRELKDIFDIQENVAVEVVEALKLRLLPANSLAAERRTANVRAYEEYLLGRQYRDGISAERQRHAQAAFARAVALDPNFAPAHAGIALAAAQLGNMTMTTAPYDLALAEAERAMALAPRLTEAYVARAYVRMHRNWDFIGARTDLEYASSIDPNNVELMQAYGTYLWMTGRVAAALEVQQRSVARNPLSSTAWDWLGVMHLDAREYAAARKAFERGAELSPYSDYRALLRTLVELYSGNRQEALRLARLNVDSSLGRFGLALVTFETGHPDEARAATQALISTVPDEAAAQIAVLHASQGKGDETFAWLERAVANRDPGLFSVQYHPELDRFKQDPRWARVLRLMNLAR